MSEKKKIGDGRPASSPPATPHSIQDTAIVPDFRLSEFADRRDVAAAEDGLLDAAIELGWSLQPRSVQQVLNRLHEARQRLLAIPGGRGGNTEAWATAVQVARIYSDARHVGITGIPTLPPGVPDVMPDGGWAALIARLPVAETQPRREDLHQAIDGLERCCREIIELRPDGGESPTGPVGKRPIATISLDGKCSCADWSIQLEESETAVVMSLAELRSATLKQLTNRSGAEDAARVLKRVLKKHPQLVGLITLPGGRGKGGYRTSIITAPQSATIG